MYIEKIIKEKLLCDNAKKLSPNELLDLIKEAVTPSMPYLSWPGEQPMEIMPILDYSLASRDWKFVGDIRGVDNIVKIVHDVDFGGSEGIYLDISVITLIGNQDIKTHLFTFKTLEDGCAAYAAMSTLGGMIAYALDLFFMFLHSVETTTL